MSTFVTQNDNVSDSDFEGLIMDNNDTSKNESFQQLRETQIDLSMQTEKLVELQQHCQSLAALAHITMLEILKGDNQSTLGAQITIQNPISSISKARDIEHTIFAENEKNAPKGEFNLSQISNIDMASNMQTLEPISTTLNTSASHYDEDITAPATRLDNDKIIDERLYNTQYDPDSETNRASSRILESNLAPDRDPDDNKSIDEILHNIHGHLDGKINNQLHSTVHQIIADPDTQFTDAENIDILLHNIQNHLYVDDHRPSSMDHENIAASNPQPDDIRSIDEIIQNIHNQLDGDDRSPSPPPPLERPPALSHADTNQNYMN